MSNSLTFGYCYEGFGGCGGGGVGPTGPTGPGGGGTGGSLFVGLTGTTGATGPYPIQNLYFNTDDGFTYTDVSGLTGGGAIIGNSKIKEIEDYLFDQPPPVLNPSLISQSDQNITLGWSQFTPSVDKTSFDVAPSNLGTNFNWFPYINDFSFGYQQDGNTLWRYIGAANQNAGSQTWKQYVDNNISINGGPTFMNRIEFDGSGTSATITSPTVAFINPLKINIGQLSGLGNSYRFRFAFINNSANEPNWVYWPDPSSGSIGFGNFGPANQPSSIDLTSSSFNDLKVDGLGASLALGKDASLNIPYSNVGLSVKYGGDISGNKRTGYLQFPGYGETTQKNITFTTPYNTSTGGPDWTVWGQQNISSNAYPEYTYEVELSSNTIYSSYYAANNSSDFSGVRIDASASVVDTESVRIPTKTLVNTNYDDFLTGSLGALDISINGSSSTTQTVWQRKVPAPYVSHDVHLMNPGDIMAIAPTTNTFNSAVNFGNSTNNTVSWVTANSFVGKDCSNENLSYYQLEIDGTSSNVPDLSSAWKVGGVAAFNGTDPTQNPSNSNLQLAVSGMVDSGAGTAPPGDIPRKRGYYLGATVSDTLASDLSLADIPDICNNSFNPYNYKLSQIYRNNSTLPTSTAINSIEEDFKVIEAPDQSLNITNYKTFLNNPTGTAYFYGLELPSTFTLDLSYDINDIHPTWAPSNTGNIWKNDLYIVKTGADSIIDTANAIWNTTGTNTTLNVLTPLQVTEDGLGGEGFDYQQNPFSTGPAGQQFRLVSTINNNINLTPTDILINTTTDLSWNSKPIWWDYTWAGSTTSNAEPSTIFPSGTAARPTVVITDNNISNVRLCITDGNNPFDCSYTTQQGPPTLRSTDFSETLDNNEAMWAKDKWFGSNTSTIANHPYVDYTATYHNTFTGGGTGLLDYSGSANNGDDSGPIVIASTNSYTASGINIAGGYDNLKWIMIKMDCNASKTDLGVLIDDENPIASGSSKNIYTDLMMFYCEEVASAYTWQNSTGANYSPPNIGISPWLDCGNTQTQAANQVRTWADSRTTFSEGINNGCCISSKTGTTGTGTPSGRFIRWVKGGSAASKRYIAIGIKEGDTIGKITLI